MKITTQDIEGIFGIVPTPAVEGADHWSVVDSINYGETEKMIRAVLAGGCDMIATNGTFGEGATVTFDELKSFTRCVADAIGGTRPFFAGVTTLNTRDTVERCRAIIDAGADGLFVGRPMWLAMDQAAILRFYQDVAEAMPGVPLVVYDNALTFKGKISTETYAQLAAIPEVVAAKHTGGPIADDMKAVGHDMRVLPLLANWHETARELPDLAKAAWAGSIACAPNAVMRQAKAIRDRDWRLADELGEQFRWAERIMMPGGDLATFMDYSIQIAHCRFKTAGIFDPGPPRPPYLFLPDDYREGGLECGRRWAEIEARFAPAA